MYGSLDSRNHLVLQRICEQYGDLVRTGPNEITICRPDAFEILDGPKNNNIRDVWYDILHPRKALVFARQPDEIRALRQSWSLAVSSRCLAAYSPRIVKLSDDLVDCISSYNGEPVKMNDIMSWFSFDAMGEITFGEDFGLMRNKQTTSILTHQRQALALLAPFNDTTWLAHAGFSLFRFLDVIKNWWAAVYFCESRMEERMKRNPDKLDMSTFFISGYQSTSKTHSTYRRNVLMGNSISAIVAGSDTTRGSLIGIWYYLCHAPEHMQKIYDEVCNIDINDVSKLALLPHLNAIIKETLRLAPPAMTGGSRITDSTGLSVGNQFIPAGIKVTAPKYVIHRLPTAFKHANDFIPERWTTRPDLVLDSRAYAPFSVGPHQCIGKGISQSEMRLVTAKLVKRYHVKFSAVHDPEAFVRDMRDQVTMMPGDLFCTFELRRND